MYISARQSTAQGDVHPLVAMQIFELGQFANLETIVACV